MDTLKYLPACAAILKEKLELPEKVPSTTREELASFICPTIGGLLDRDMAKLLQLCYQIDLGEEKLKAILRDSPVASMAMELSLALVDRQLLKLAIREKYSGD